MDSPNSLLVYSEEDKKKRPPGWRSGLGHCIATRDSGSRPGSVAAGRDREVRGATHNWPSVVRVREGLAGRDILVSSCTSDTCGGPGAVHANQVARCTVFHPVRLASWLDAVLKKQGGLVGLCFGGRMAFDLRLSRARTGVVAMRQDSNY